MTEEDAKKKWCPMIRMNPITGEEQYSGVTTRENSDEHRNCIVSACMMWVPTDNFCKPSYPGDPRAMQKSKPAGYCGLAGGRP